MTLARLSSQHRRARRRKTSAGEPREIIRDFLRVLETLCHRPLAPRRRDKGGR